MRTPFVGVRSGCEPIENKTGTSALISAISKDKCETFDQLLTAGADVNAVNNTGHTALTIAAIMGNVRIAKCLLNANCRINMVQNALMSHLELFEPVHRGLVSLLFAAGEILDDADDDLKDLAQDVLQFKEIRIQLKHICRKAVRKHLLNLDPHEHLFGRIPRLELPEIITQYLLYDQSLNNDDESVYDDDDDDDDDDFEHDDDFDADADDDDETHDVCNMIS